MILLPAVCLLCAASWAATLGGLGGECILQDGGKQTRTTAVLLLMKPELILDLKTDGVHFIASECLHFANTQQCGRVRLIFWPFLQL